MTKQEYEMVAKALKATLAEERISQESLRAVAGNLAWEFKQQNSRFVLDKFYAACGLEEKEDA